IVALVKALNVVAIEAFITDLHPSAQRAHVRKFLDGELDRLRCRCKAGIAQRLSCPALALWHEQLGGNTVVEWLGLDLYKSPPPCSARSLRTRPSYMPIVFLCQSSSRRVVSTHAPPSLRSRFCIRPDSRTRRRIKSCQTDM